MAIASGTHPDMLPGKRMMIRDILKFRGKILKIGLPALISRGVIVLWGFFTILIIRVLPQETYAAYAIARSIQIFAIMFGGSFIMSSIVKFTSEANTDREKKIGNAGILISMLVACFVAAILIFSGGILKSFYSDVDLTGIPVILAILVVTSTASNLPRNFLISRYKTMQIMYADIASTIIRIAVILVFMLTDSLNSAVQIFESMIAGNITALLVNLYFARGYMDLSLGYEKEHVKMLIRFSLVLLGGGLANSIYTRTDILILGKLAGDAETAGYSACRTLTSLMINLNMASKIVMLPLLSRMWQSKENRRNVIRRVMSAILLIYIIQIPVVVFFSGFPKETLHFLYSGKYDSAWPILMVLGLLAFVRAFGSQFSNLSVAMGKPSFPLYSLFVSAVLNVILNFILIPDYGAFGAAIATVIAVVMGSASVVFFTYGYYKRNTTSA